MQSTGYAPSHYMILYVNYISTSWGKRKADEVVENIKLDDEDD